MEQKRLFCVDLLRGIDIFYLLVVWYGLLEGGFLKVWPVTDAAARAFWYHSLTAFESPGAASTGFGILDCTQPLFIFVTGVSASLAMRKFVTADGVDLVAFWKRLASRTLMLWVCGSLIRGILTFRLFTGSQPSFCLYSDTLHTIAVAYFAASVGLLLRRPGLRLAVGLLLVAAAGTAMALGGDYSQHGNAARLLEEAAYARLGGRAKDFCYLLPTFMWAGMGILASLAGDVLKSDAAAWTKARILSAAGACSLVLGLVLSAWIPPIRYIYTASFVFETLGGSALLLAALFVLTDVWNVRRGTGFLILFGQCSLAAWMTMNFFGGALTAAAQCFVGGLPELLGSSTYQPIFVAVARMAILFWVLLAWRRLRAKGHVSH